MLGAFVFFWGLLRSWADEVLRGCVLGRRIRG